MAAIAGIVNLSGPESIGADIPERMSQALAHRDPVGGIHVEPGLALAWRCSPGACAIESVPANETNDILAIAEGLLTNASDLRNELETRQHQVRSTEPAELLVHLWEDRGLALVEKLRGQFAFALWDHRRRALFLGRDRIGIVPLYWSQCGPWLLFASEMKALFASGLVKPALDPRGLDHIFTFMGLPAARTCFRGVQALLAGHQLLAESGNVRVERYWDLDFPNQGDEEKPVNDVQATDQLQNLLTSAVTRRLANDDSVAGYVSGGIDASTLAALACKSQGRAIPIYTVKIDVAHLDESDRALRVGEACGLKPIVETFDGRRIIDSFPKLIQAADMPVPDPSCVTLMLLAERVGADGRRAVLAGDGADDLFAGYAWFKTDRVLRSLDVIPGLPFGRLLRRLVLRWTAPHIHARTVKRTQSLIGGHNAWLDLYGLISLNRSRFYSERMLEMVDGHVAYEDLALSLDRMRRWHPLNRALYFGMKTHVPGLLLQAKGDRIAMQSGVELRFPYLDEDVIAFSAKLSPKWKLRRFRDKYLLRRVAERFLPHDIAWRPKSDFVAPFDNLYRRPAPPWVEQLLSEESLLRTGYFNPAAVNFWRQHYKKLSRLGSRRFSVEIGLSAVVATQLWHHLYLEPSLAELPG